MVSEQTAEAIDREVGYCETSHQQALDILSATETCWRRLQPIAGDRSNRG